MFSFIDSLTSPSSQDKLMAYCKQSDLFDTNFTLENRAAFKTQALEKIMAFMEAGADINLVENQTTPLLTAIDCNNFYAAHALMVAGANVNGICDNQTPLLLAIEQENQELVALLIKYNAKVNVSVQKRIPLIEAVEQENIEIVVMLLNAGARLDDKFKTSALIEAIEAGNTEMVSILITAGANVNYIPHRKVGHPLIKAVEQNNLELTKMLVKAGANVNCKFSHLTPLIIACRFPGISMAQYLIKHGAEINPKGLPNTPLLQAIETENIELILYLLEQDADVNLKSTSGQNGSTAPLLGAASTKNIDIVSLILNANPKPNINVTDDDGDSALIIAAGDDNLKMVELLVKAGANIKLKNTEGQNAAMVNPALNGWIEELVKEEKKSLREIYHNYCAVRDENLTKEYADEKQTLQAIQEIHDINWQILTGAINFHMEHADRLPTDYKKFSNALIHMANLITILNDSKVPVEIQEKMDPLAQRLREVAAAFGHSAGQRMMLFRGYEKEEEKGLSKEVEGELKEDYSYGS